MKVSRVFIKGSRVVEQQTKLKSTNLLTSIKKKNLRSDVRQFFIIFYPDFGSLNITIPSNITVLC